jgi:hypothetical protein
MTCVLYKLGGGLLPDVPVLVSSPLSIASVDYKVSNIIPITRCFNDLLLSVVPMFDSSPFASVDNKVSDNILITRCFNDPVDPF